MTGERRGIEEEGADRVSENLDLAGILQRMVGNRQRNSGLRKNDLKGKKMKNWGMGYRDSIFKFQG